jgi:hypothetical protein
MAAARGWAQAGTAPAASEPAGSAAPAAGDTLGRLERAAALHDRGVLTDDEFAAEKRSILDDSAPAPA